MEIGKKEITAIYSEFKAVYENKKDKKDALDFLKNLPMNIGSAKIHFAGLEQLINGEEYNRTMNEESIDYYLEQIFSDFGKYKLNKALHCINNHLDYYELKKGYRLKGIEKILEKYWAKLDNMINEIVYPDEIDEYTPCVEGAKISKLINAYERDEKAKKICLKFYGYNCSVCDMNFEKAYGTIGINYIHVHHLIPLSEIKKEYIVDPIKDLKPVCPNCHAMLHRKKPNFTIEELKNILKKENKK